MTDETNPLSRTYHNHKIEFHPSDLKFHVSGPEFEHFKESYCTFPSFDEARSQIDKLVDDAAKFKAQNSKFEARVCDEHGNLTTITGINRSTGRIQGVDTRYIYPDVEWVVTDLRRYDVLWTELKQIENRISPLRINTGQTSSRIAADDYPRRLEALSKSLNEKLELAKQQTPAEIVELKA
jgi:hypothetical protein